MTARFTQPLRLDQIRDGMRIDLGADDDDRAKIARRLGLGNLDRLEAHAAIKRDGETIRAMGRLSASLAQSCVVTGEPIAVSLDEPFDVIFMPEPRIEGPEQEIELGAEDCDVVFHDGARIDLGAAIADSMALALDPYPRSAGADAALREAGVISEEEAGPFAALSQLKGRLGAGES